MVIWIIGKSGSGKTFFAKHLFQFLKKKKINKIKWLDGDKFRKNHSFDLGYSLSDRRKNGIRIQKYCKEYERKDYIVIASIASLFRDQQKRNKKNFKHYIQIYVKVKTSLLIKRNARNVYSNKKNVIGKHIKFIEPIKSNFELKNNFNKAYTKKIFLISRTIFKLLK